LTPETYGYEAPQTGLQLSPITGPGSPSAVRQEFIEGLFGDLKDFFVGGEVTGIGGLAGAEAGQDTGGLLGELRDLLSGLFGADGEDPAITTKLQIESTTNTIVQLDGQVIANAIKPYLLNDEVRYEGTAGAAVKRFVI
jgi:hypothetical protein